MLHRPWRTPELIHPFRCWRGPSQTLLVAQREPWWRSQVRRSSPRDNSRQLQPMRDGPSYDECHVLLALQPLTDRFSINPAVGEHQMLGVVAATGRMSRRVLSLEFKAIYVVPQLRGKSLANSMVHISVQEIGHQTNSGKTPWKADTLENMMAFVTLCAHPSSSCDARRARPHRLPLHPSHLCAPTLRVGSPGRTACRRPPSFGVALALTWAPTSTASSTSRPPCSP